MKIPRPSPNAIISQTPVRRVPFTPGNRDVIMPPPARPGGPPDTEAFAVTTFDGRQKLMRDFHYKIPRGGFINSQDSIPIVGGEPVITATTRFLYPVDIANQFADIGPVPLADATPNGGGIIVAEPTFPRGSGYNASGGSGTRLDLPDLAVPNMDTDDFTLEFWARGTNWNGGGAGGIGVFNIIGDVSSISLNALKVGTQFGLARLVMHNSVGVNVIDNTSIPLAANSTHFFSVTRNGDDMLFHIDGLLQTGFPINVAGSSFQFSSAAPIADNIVSFADVNGWLGGVIGLVSDIRFTTDALYSAADYTPPILPLQSQQGGTNFGSYAMQVPDGYRMILRGVTIAGGLQFRDTVGGQTVALSSASGPNDDFFGAILAGSPQMTFYRNSVPLNDISFGNTPGISSSNNMAELIYGRIFVPMYEIFDSGDTFVVGVAQNPAWTPGAALWGISDHTYCYLEGNIIPSDSAALTSTGLTKKSVPVVEKEGLLV